MPEPTAGDVALACATLLVDELARGGARLACVAPGSRSAPIALALERHPTIEVQVHLDERSAAFVALGHAKATGRPAIVACTSGTAAANLHPAVVEAHHARMPLVVLTADRPPELRDTGANQTIDQVRLFGNAVRWFAEPGVPEAYAGAARAWRSLGANAIAAAAGLPRGPVHLNLPFREPLVPTGASVDLGPDARGRADGEPWMRVAPAAVVPEEVSLESLAALLAGAERGAIVAGPIERDASAVARLASAVGWPLVAEPLSWARSAPHALAAPQQLLADDAFAAAHVPDVVLQLGGSPTSRATLAFVARAGQLVVVDPDGRRPDPARAASLVVRADPSALADALASRVAKAHAGEWLAAWRDADARARTALDAAFDRWIDPFEPRVARDVAAALPDGAALVVGSSTPVRDLDASMAPRDGLRVYGNRGASGIDGFVSTVLGIATAGGPVCALTGDLGLLHDAAGLLWAARSARNVCIVVLNNGGGGIFDLLPQSSLPEHERLFVTPHEVDLAALASAAGVGYMRVGHAREVAAVVREATGDGGVRIVEVPIDRRWSVVRRAELRGMVAAAIAERGRL